jgi:hypothetical protein
MAAHFPIQSYPFKKERKKTDRLVPFVVLRQLKRRVSETRDVDRRLQLVRKVYKKLIPMGFNFKKFIRFLP